MTARIRRFAHRLLTFGASRLGRIPPEEVENWLNDEIDAGIALSSVHRHDRTLRRMLQVAVGKQKVLTNPWRSTCVERILDVGGP